MPEKSLPKVVSDLPTSEKEVPDKASEKFPRPLIVLMILGLFFVILSIIMTALVFYSYNKLASWGYLEKTAPTTFTPSDVLITAPPGGNPTDGTMVACTMEAKLCPDGSSVGRSGPNCEFEKCPGE
jgi:hypothetical protein